MSTFKFAVLGNLDHDQEKYEPGDSVVMTEGEAEALIAVGVLRGRPIREIEDEADKDATAPKPKSSKPAKATVAVDAGGEKAEAGGEVQT